MGHDPATACPNWPMTWHTAAPRRNRSHASAVPNRQIPPEGRRAFIDVPRRRDHRIKSASDARARPGSPVGDRRFANLGQGPVRYSGQVTRAGSIVLNDAPPALADAPVIAHLKAAGAVPIGRTNMTEFALWRQWPDAHYGTPSIPGTVAHKRIPGDPPPGARSASPTAWRRPPWIGHWRIGAQSRRR